MTLNVLLTMANESYIIDQPVPVTQDFRSLKQEGIGFIREYTGNEWTNLNASDPGITILDQLCYALTELGYCNDFSVGDILTEPNGRLKTDNNFYLPEKIITTSPVTIDDYRKYIIDAAAAVDNVMIVPISAANGLNIYQCFLLLNELVKPGDIKAICTSVNYLLNKSRNLNELFLPVSVLQDISFLVAGKIEINNDRATNDVLPAIQQAVRNYIFPDVPGSGYNEPYFDGLEDQELFDGPFLKKGWIPSALLGEKRNLVTLSELVNIIGTVPGIKNISISAFVDPVSSGKTNECVTNNAADLIVIDFAGSIQQQQLIIVGGSPEDIDLNKNLQPAVLDHTPAALPGFTYRNIGQYYSIQNTFPEIFAVGANAVSDNATDFQVAQSRQLKGYLTLFDQLLANQFSQLANIGKLFSFKNSMTGASFDVNNIGTIKNEFEKKHPEYPVPYLRFPSTYFYQPLYDIPHIKPLLKDNNIFMFGTGLEPKKIQEKNSWDKYMKDPYNPYIHGLMESMENEETSLKRRNDILDQLLARHGESPMMMNLFIDGSKYAGSRDKDRVIFKSLYLQNLGLLSYYRMKAWNFLAAKKIADTVADLPSDFKKKFPTSYDDDFIFNSGWIDRMEKLKEQHFIDFSALELKLSLLFGLKPMYRDFITVNLQSPILQTQLQQAFWLMEERRCMIFIETGLLLHSAGDEPAANQNGYASVTANNVLVILPGFITGIGTPVFKRRLEVFLENSLPATATADICFIGTDQLSTLIPAFANWHNALVYNSNDEMDEEKIRTYATGLIKLITAIKLPG